MELKDAMTDQVTRVAVVESEEGHQLGISKRPNGNVWLTFVRSESAAGKVLSRTKAPMYRVDQLPAHDLSVNVLLESTKVGAGSSYVRTPRSVSVRIWTIDSRESIAWLAEIATGTRLLWRAFYLDGPSDDVAFTLDGAGQAVADVLGLQDKGGVDWIKQRASLDAARTALRQRCSQPGGVDDRLRCIDRLNACFANTTTLAEIEACR